MSIRIGELVEGQVIDYAIAKEVANMEKLGKENISDVSCGRGYLWCFHEFPTLYYCPSGIITVYRWKARKNCVLKAVHEALKESLKNSSS